MARLLYIQASPRERSHSTKVAKKFLESYAQHHPNDTIEILDLWNLQLPPFNGHTIQAKYNVLHNLPHEPADAKAWEKVKEIFQHFNAADKFVMSVPMWNFHIPYPLKHYIDVITQPGLAFNLSPEGTYIPLVIGKSVVLIYASGGTYKPGSGFELFDFQKPYMKTWFEFIGFKHIHEIVSDGTLMSQAKEQEEKAIQEAIKIAMKF
jgi:FMN-dependent NADH-azoreductase